jgi:hypothetical protein
MSRSRDAIIDDVMRVMREKLEELFDVAYRAGHEEALKRIIEVAREKVDMPPPGGREPGAVGRSRRSRPRRADRDERVREILSSAEKPLSITEIMHRLAGLGDVAPRSSAIVVLKRLISQGLARRDESGRYVMREAHKNGIASISTVQYVNAPGEGEPGQARPSPDTRSGK